MKTTLSIALLSLGLVAGAQAHTSGVQGSAGIGGSATVYGGSITGNAGSSSTGSAITTTEIDGAGRSIQRQANQTGATASIGGTIGANGVNVASGTTEFSNSQGFGSSSGDTPVKVGGSIVNGGEAFGDGEASAGVTSSFTKASIGGDLAIKGFEQIGSIH